jgi:hypothetical protein
LRALEPDPELRPRISEIRSAFATPVLQALVNTVSEYLGRYLNAAKQHRSLSMDLWFEEERIRAFSNILSPGYDDKEHFFQDFKAYSACCDVMFKILRIIESELDSGSVSSTAVLPVETLYDRRGSFEDQIRSLVRELWAVLPRAYERRAQAIWFHSMQTNDKDRLNKIHTCNPINEKNCSI